MINPTLKQARLAADNAKNDYMDALADGAGNVDNLPSISYYLKRWHALEGDFAALSADAIFKGETNMAEVLS